MEETADDFCREIMKVLWHAYDMLDTLCSGTVHVSQLKVVTSNIGLRLGIDKAEEILDKDGTMTMDFKSYFDIVKKELIDKQQLPENPDDAFLGNRLNGIVKTCWTLCNFERRHVCKAFTSEHGLLLWRLYNFLSETDESGNPIVPLKLDPEEAGLLLKEFVDVTGLKNKEQQVRQFITDSKDEPLTFTDFLNVFEKGYAAGLSNKGITQGLNRLYETFILNVLARGMLWKRGHKVRNWKERFLVLTPTQLRYFVTPDEKVLKGSIEFDSDCSVEVLIDRPSSKPNRFVVHTKKKPYEISAPDLKTKNEWVSAIQLALSRLGEDPNIQKETAFERCRARAEKRRRTADDERKRAEEAERLKQSQDELDEAKKKRLEDEELLRARLFELEEEKRRREEAESRWQEEQALREAEQERLRELEAIKQELERLLAEERQAKRDEEIVRNLQARLLEEEFEKREELERLQQQQDEMLRAEREQKAVLESDRLKQEQLLAEAQVRLNQLEQERAAASQKMEEATEKLQRAEKDRQIMEEKVKLWKTPVGLARPIQPKGVPLVTHRGRGAFCEKDFARKELIDEADINGNGDNDGNFRKNDDTNIGENIDKTEKEDGAPVSPEGRAMEENKHGDSSAEDITRDLDNTVKHCGNNGCNDESFCQKDDENIGENIDKADKTAKLDDTNYSLYEESVREESAPVRSIDTEGRAVEEKKDGDSPGEDVIRDLNEDAYNTEDKIGMDSEIAGTGEQSNLQDSEQNELKDSYKPVNKGNMDIRENFPTKTESNKFPDVENANSQNLGINGGTNCTCELETNES